MQKRSQLCLGIFRRARIWRYKSLETTFGSLRQFVFKILPKDQNLREQVFRSRFHNWKKNISQGSTCSIKVYVLDGINYPFQRSYRLNITKANDKKCLEIYKKEFEWLFLEKTLFKILKDNLTSNIKGVKWNILSNLESYLLTFHFLCIYFLNYVEIF